MDAGGHLEALDRSDLAPFVTVVVAIDKHGPRPPEASRRTRATACPGPEGRAARVAAAAGRGRRRLPDRRPGCPGRCIGVSVGTALQGQEIAEAALSRCGFDVGKRRESSPYRRRADRFVPRIFSKLQVAQMNWRPCSVHRVSRCREAQAEGTTRFETMSALRADSDRRMARPSSPDRRQPRRCYPWGIRVSCRRTLRHRAGSACSTTRRLRWAATTTNF